MYTVFVLETVQTALSGADLYYWFASGYGNMNHLASPFASTFDIPVIESMVSAMVQFFYAYRVWTLSNTQSRWFCLIICLVGRSQSSLKHPYSVLSSLQCSALNAVGGFTGGIYVRAYFQLSLYSNSLSQAHVKGTFASDRTLQNIAIV